MPPWLTETGAGRPVLLLHGWTGFKEVWGDLPARLAADGHQVLALDLPGWGRAPAPRGLRHDASGYAAAIAPLVEERGPMDVIGHSMGGQVALTLAASLPQMIRRVVAISTPVIPARRPVLPPRTLVHVVGLPLVGRPLARLLLAIMARRPERVATAYRRSVHDPDRMARDPALRALFDTLVARLRATPVRVVAESLWRISRIDLRPILSEIRQPTLAIVGDHDGSVNPGNSATIARSTQHGRLLRVADAAHVPFLERPDVVVPAILEFLDAPD